MAKHGQREQQEKQRPEHAAKVNRLLALTNIFSMFAAIQHVNP